MDRSLDSIGSCSLDVDADSSDISDTSGSLNFPTPISIKDITREFTANIRERCTVVERSPIVQNTTTYLDPATGRLCMVLTEPSAAAGGGGGGVGVGTGISGAGVDIGKKSVDAYLVKSASNELTTTEIDVHVYDKKPSYLNLACCVNGYSNLTTYDSKIRQDINKSREVSPIRPSSSSIQYCKKNNSLAAPVLHSMSNVGANGAPPLTKQPSSGAKYAMSQKNNNNNKSSKIKSSNHIYENGIGVEHHNGENGSSRNGNATSFIQQRVERLYGPGALAQGFYSPKKHISLRTSKDHYLDAGKTTDSTELARKFKQLSPSKDYSGFRKKLDQNASTTRQAECNATAAVQRASNEDVDLPVFRHLSQEFRAQLPTAVSPKRNYMRASPASDAVSSTNGSSSLKEEPTGDVVDHKAIHVAEPSTEFYLTTSKVLPISETNVEPSITEIEACGTGDTDPKDGNHFLKILKVEQTRLLSLAGVAEKYIDALSNNPEISEDTFGLLRSASGKARLLVSQKMKQFEGLCHNNLNRSPEDKFPTTVDDLQGFWDMVNLQIDHVDSIFEDIEKLKSNDWKNPMDPIPPNNVLKSQKSSIKTGNLKPKTNISSVNSSKASDAVRTATALKREAQRKQIMEMKRKHREALAAAAAANNSVNTEHKSEDSTTGDSIIVIGGDNSS